MNRSQIQRMWLVVAGLVGLTVVIVGRLFAFQVVQGEQWRAVGETNRQTRVLANPNRGIIYDRNGTALAANGFDYQVNVAPNLVLEKGALATALAPILNESRQSILAKLESGLPNVLIEGRVSTDIAEAIDALPYKGIEIYPLPRRIYPQGNLLSHVLGYVDFDGVGGSGLEGYFHAELAGEAASAMVDVSPLAPQPNVIAREGIDLVLTIDRSVQWLVEQYLERGLKEHDAESGTIIVMDPRTGAILAMASKPDFDPYRYFDISDPSVLVNPAVTSQYEPGSVMKLITMAIALDAGIVTPQSTYFDNGILEVGGNPIYNSDRAAHGETDMTTLLAKSLNIGAATLALDVGPDIYYDYMTQFNFGRKIGINLSAEGSGKMYLPGDPLWTESSLATNSFGQGLSVTPLQQIAATAALANEGYMMRPYIVQEIRRPGQEPIVMKPEEIGHPISRETAQQVTAMAIAAIQREITLAQVDGYTIAGKTGTAQIPEGGVYHPDDVIGSFIGWLPADDPEIIVLVKLDRPQINPWGSRTAAPLFSDLATELVTLLNIPPDQIRLEREVHEARQQ